MIARLILAIALFLGALPASVAMPACHETMTTTASHAAMPMEQGDAPPAPRPARGGEALCVGCIAPSTIKVASVTAPCAPVAMHGAAVPTRSIAGALLPPEPPPPRD
jgi:hypothetical protein